MKNLTSLFLMLGALLGITASCTSDALEIEENVTATKGFTIYATTEDAQNQTRLGLADDGMTMLWEYGDKLVLVNKASGDSIQMPVNMVEGAAPAASASFTSEEGVAPGEYWVLCNIDSKSLTLNSYPLFTKEEIKSRKLLKLYASLTVAQDQVTANIALKNAYAKVRIHLKNAGELSGQVYSLGMLTSKGLSTQQKLSTAVDSVAFEHVEGTFQHEFINSDYSTYEIANYLSLQTELYSMILPQNLLGENVYFYIRGVGGVREFKKAGINLESGKSYVVNLDLSQPTEYRTSKKTELETASDLRFARYYGGGTYSLANDIDLQGEDVFPLFRTPEPYKYTNFGSSVNVLNGNGHTLKNLSIQAPGCDQVSLHYNVHNLTIENANIEGKNYVSSMGYQSIVTNLSTNCHLTGTCTIVGKENVGGLFITGEVHHSSVKGNINISGTNNVGGICAQRGYGSYLTVGNNVSVSGKNNIGGVFGYTDTEKTISYTTTSASVSGEYQVGGISGSCSSHIVKCGNLGTINGTTYVGGISGYYTSNIDSNSYREIVTSNSYNTGNINGTTYVGGLFGYMYSYSLTDKQYFNVKQCYNSGNIVSSLSGNYIGGLAGYSETRNSRKITTFSNCYSIGSISGGQTGIGGIMGYSDGYLSILNCYSSSSNESDTFAGFVGGVSSSNYSISNSVTSLPTAVGSGSSYSDFCGKNPIHSGDPNNNPCMDILNSGETKYYSESTTQMWPISNYYAHCPVFVWQTDPLTGEVITSPSFSEETEW